MKNLIITAVLCFSIFGFSQNTQNSVRTITVSGSAEVITKAPLYKTEVTLSLENNYYADNPCTTLDELKAKYFAEIEKQGIDSSKFEDDELRYAATGYRKEGTILIFTTSDKDEVLKINKLKMGQTTPSYVQMKHEVDESQLYKSLKIAMDDAKDNAELIAKASGLELGNIHSVTNYDSRETTYWQSMNSTPLKLRVTVVYSVK